MGRDCWRGRCSTNTLSPPVKSASGSLIAKLGAPGDVPVAIERPDGRLVDALLAAGHPVVPVKPNAIKTWRRAR
jgi:hypothetical protein